MIIRRRALTPDADEVSMFVSYSAANVLEMFRRMFRLHECDEIAEGELFTYKFSDIDLYRYLEANDFKYYQKKYRRTLSEWAVRLAVRKGYLRKEDDERRRVYYFSEILAKRVGRPKQKQAFDVEFRGEDDDEG